MDNRELFEVWYDSFNMEQPHFMDSTSARKMLAWFSYKACAEQKDKEIAELKEALKQFIDRTQALPPEFKKIVDGNFWELLQ